MSIYLILSIIIFLFIIAMIIFRFREEKDLSENSENPEELTEKFENKRKIKIGLFLAVLIGVVATIVLKERGTNISDSDSDGFNVAVFVPVWIAVFVPLLANKNKKIKNSQATEDQKRLALIIGILAVLVAFGVLIFGSIK